MEKKAIGQNWPSTRKICVSQKNISINCSVEYLKMRWWHSRYLAFWPSLKKHFEPRGQLKMTRGTFGKNHQYLNYISIFHTLWVSVLFCHKGTFQWVFCKTSTAIKGGCLKHSLIILRHRHSQFYNVIVGLIMTISVRSFNIRGLQHWGRYK